MIIACITDHIKKQFHAPPIVSDDEARWWP